MLIPQSLAHHVNHVGAGWGQFLLAYHRLFYFWFAIAICVASLYTDVMPNYETHPLRVIRRRHGLEMKELARLAGVSRATVSQIEEGRTKHPNDRVIAVLARLSGEDPKELFSRVVSWGGQRLEDLVPRRALSALQLPPEALVDLYPSFAAWRSEFADNPTRFASFLRINRLTVAKYESGGFVGGMPDSLVHALIARFGLSDAYLLAVEELPVG